MSKKYARFLSQYKFKEQSVFSARFDNHYGDDQLLDEIVFEKLFQKLFEI